MKNKKHRGKLLNSSEITTERENQIWELRQKCWTQERIAKEIGISQPAVAKTLKRLSDRYYQELMEDIKTAKANQITQLEHISDEAMQSWEKSKGTTYINKKGDTPFVFAGDSKFLMTAMKAKEDIRKIMGADAPTKSFNYNKDITSMSDEELQNIVNGKESTSD